jgi:hypothetical protein
MGTNPAGRTILRRGGRAVIGAVGAALIALVSTACWPQIPPGPAFTDVTMTPSAVIAGSTFTLSVTAKTSNGNVGSISMVVRTPTGGYLPWTPGCTQGHAAIGASAPERSASWQCTIPEGAPNGSWHIELRAFDEGYGVTEVEVPFEVTGGSDDLQGPQGVLTIPTTASRGTSFSFTLRASDEHPVAEFFQFDVVTLQQNPSLGSDRFECAGSWTPIDATTSDYHGTCTVPAGQSPGDYHTYGLRLYDAFGQSSPVDIATTVV